LKSFKHHFVEKVYSSEQSTGAKESSFSLNAGAGSMVREILHRSRTANPFGQSSAHVQQQVSWCNLVTSQNDFFNKKRRGNSR